MNDLTQAVVHDVNDLAERLSLAAHGFDRHPVDNDPSPLTDSDRNTAYAIERPRLAQHLLRRRKRIERIRRRGRAVEWIFWRSWRLGGSVLSEPNGLQAI
jgi:hypothetical protein